MTRARRALLLLLAAGAVLAVPSLAADPESGTVSKGSPKVSWTGVSINGGATTIPAIASGGAPVCQAPSCDTFALTVGDSADLTVSATSDSAGGFTMLEIVKPDGSKNYNYGSETDPKTTIKIKKAPTGDYEVHVATNTAADDTYSASAELAVPPPAPPAGATPTPTPAAPPADESATLTIVTRKASARRVKRRVPVAISTSKPVTGLKGTLRRGAKTVARGSLARLEGSGRITFRLKRSIRRGTYVVGLVAKDAGGRTVGASARLRVRR